MNFRPLTSKPAFWGGNGELGGVAETPKARGWLVNGVTGPWAGRLWPWLILGLWIEPGSEGGSVSPLNKQSAVMFLPLHNLEFPVWEKNWAGLVWAQCKQASSLPMCAGSFTGPGPL